MNACAHASERETAKRWRKKCGSKGAFQLLSWMQVKTMAILCAADNFFEIKKKNKYKKLKPERIYLQRNPELAHTNDCLVGRKCRWKKTI